MRNSCSGTRLVAYAPGLTVMGGGKPQLKYDVT